MFRRVILSCIICLTSTITTRAISADDQRAREAAVQWLLTLDAGKYSQAYHEMPPRVRTAKGEENFVNWMKTRRAPFGQARTRKFLRAVKTTKLLGSPDGNYQKIGFKTSFDRKKDGAEALVLTNETGSWKVSGYKIY